MVLINKSIILVEFICYDIFLGYFGGVACLERGSYSAIRIRVFLLACESITS